MDMLATETCRLFLPAAFIQTGEGVFASYQTEGYCRLTALKENDTEDVLSIILSLLYGIEDAQCHYIYPDEYQINQESIFVKRGLHQVKAVYLPEEKASPLSEKVISLLRHLEGTVDEEGREYLDDAVTFIRQDAFCSKAVIHHLEKLRKEVYLCGVK